MKILVKYPTRQRPHLFLKNIAEYYSKANDNSNIVYLVSCDTDDISMSDEVIEEAKLIIPDIIIMRGESYSKIHACNRDVEMPQLMGIHWDILLIISDDMFVQCEGWDKHIREEMIKNYSDTDGCLWFHDGTRQRSISTLSCIGRKYYDRFGYIYYPEYKSFFCDNEYTEIAKKMNKIIFIDNTIIKHEHPCWDGSMPNDDLYKRNEVHWKHDEALFTERKENNFGI